MKKGSDYDVEVFYPDGFAEPVDAKCKFETTEINPQSILIFLEKARKQLPDDLCRHHIHEGAPELGSRRRIGWILASSLRGTQIASCPSSFMSHFLRLAITW
jgi:hypothetical protein